jgi:hypothetical protein
MKKNKRDKKSSKGCFWKSFKGITLLSIIGVIMLVALFVGYISFAPVAWIDGEAVDKRELNLYMESERSNVYGQYQTKYGAKYSKDFWTSSFDGQKPENTLTETALGKLKKDKVIQILARELGVSDSISYGSFLNQFKSENNRRKDLLKTNGVIYGPQQYEERIYYDYLLENMITQSEVKLKDTLFKYTEEELRSYYEEKKGQMFRNVDTVETEWIYIKGSNNASSLDTLEKLRRKMAESQNFSKYVKEINDEKYEIVFRNVRQFGGERAKEQARNEPELYNSALALNKNEISELIEAGGTTGFLVCTDRKGNSYIPYNDCRDNVVRAFIEDKYQKYIGILLREQSQPQSRKIC